MPSVEHLLSTADMQRLLREWLASFGHTDQKQLEAVPLSSKLSQTRSKGGATVVQAVSDTLEIVLPGTSKGSGVKALHDHLGVTADLICSISLFFFILQSFLFPD